MGRRSEQAQEPANRSRTLLALLAVVLVFTGLVVMGVHVDQVAGLYHGLLPWPRLVAGLGTIVPTAVLLAGGAAIAWSGWRRWLPTVLVLPFVPLVLLAVPGRGGGRSEDRELDLAIATTFDWAAAVTHAALAGVGTVALAVAAALLCLKLPRLPIWLPPTVVVVAATVTMVATH